MAFDVTQPVDLIEIMENYLAKVRPQPEIRKQLDIGYEIEGQSVIIHEIRPVWDNPEVIMTHGYAKATFVKGKNVWKVFWRRANGKWYAYSPQPSVKHLKDFLDLVDDDEYACFKG